MSESSGRFERVVTDHVAGCDDCATTEVGARIEGSVPVLAPVLDAAPIGAARVRALSAAVRVAAAPLLMAEVRRLYGRRLTASLALAIAPLPLVYLVGSRVLGAVYGVLAGLAGEGLAAWVVGSYVLMLSLVVAVACGAIPLLVERTLPAVARPAVRRSIA